MRKLKVFKLHKLHRSFNTTNIIYIHYVDKLLVEKDKNPSDKHSTRWLDSATTASGAKETSQTSSRLSEEGHVLSYTSECERHRVDLKDAACINMRDSS
jgi:hypothetical protein